jgi:hypothetical protein
MKAIVTDYKDATSGKWFRTRKRSIFSNKTVTVEVFDPSDVRANKTAVIVSLIVRCLFGFVAGLSVVTGNHSKYSRHYANHAARVSVLNLACFIILFIGFNKLSEFQNFSALATVVSQTTDYINMMDKVQILLVAMAFMKDLLFTLYQLRLIIAACKGEKIKPVLLKKLQLWGNEDS